MSGDWLRILAVIGVCLTIAPSTKGQTKAQLVQAPEAEQATKLAALFELLESNDKFMGTVAVVKNGETIFEHQYGKIAADAKAGQTPNAETQYRVGSITKTFTAVMVLQLIEEGKLSLDSKLAEFFPEMKNAAQISILQLLGQPARRSFDPKQWGLQSCFRNRVLTAISTP